MAKIALAMILKDSEPTDMIMRCLYSVAPHVDGIFLTINGRTKKETKKAIQLKKELDILCISRSYPEVQFSYTKWEKDFAKVRNFNFGQVPSEYDFIIWLDADDILRGGENLHDLADECLQKGFSAVFFNYLYRVDLDENMKIRQVLIEHLRERLIRNDNSYMWISPIHETLIEQRETVKTDSGLCDVVHLSSDKRADAAIHRNIEILEKQLEDQGDRKDPRTLYYLAKAYFDLREDEYWLKAEDYIKKYLHGSEENTPSGWAEERAQAWEYLAEIYRDWGLYNKAIKAVSNALIEDPKFPNFYIDMAMIYMYMHDWRKAKHWALLAQQVPYPKTTLVTNPRDMQVRTIEVLLNVAINTNDIDGAWAMASKSAEIFPNDDVILDRFKHLTEIKRQNEVAHEIIDLARYLDERGQTDKLVSLVGSIPREIEEEPVMISLRRDFTPARTWEEDEVAIMCGRGFEKWSPKNLGTGIGGSEEAVIYMAKELSSLGWRVTVFGDPQEDAGMHEGVRYVPHYKLNPKDEFNILIGWRSVSFFDHDWHAKKTYLWLHDIQNPNEYTPERLDSITRIFALSEWQRNNMPNVPDDKFLVTGNGIDLDSFRQLDKSPIKRNTKRCIYTSSYDRGLEHLLKLWPEVKKEVPEAELHVFYGWKLFESFYANNPERMAWKERIDELMKQDGVYHHGRVGQLEVLEETYKSGIWAYPTHFGEISCITAMKCQAAGAIPVVCDYAALKETVQFGKKVNVDEEDIYVKDTQDKYTKELVAALKDTEWQNSIRKEMMAWARARFSWGSVAEQWDKEFRTDELKDAAKVLTDHDESLKKYLPVQLQERLGYEQTY